MIDPSFLTNIRTVLLDVDGTLLRGETPLPGASQFFEFLISQNIQYLVITNNSTKSPLDYYKKLSVISSEITPDKITTSSTITVQYLKENFPLAVVFAIGQSGIHEALSDGGFKTIENASQPADVVIVAGDYELTYEKIKNAILHIQRGAFFIGTNPDLLYPTEEGLVPECGTTIAAIEAATGKRAVVIGKPNKYMFDLVMKKLEANRSNTAIVGDRLSTDILGGINSRIRTILVETGVDNIKTISKQSIQPDLIVPDLINLTMLWENLLPIKPGINDGD